MTMKDAISAAITEAYQSRNDTELMQIAHALNIYPTRQGAYMYLVKEGIIK